MLNGNLLRVSAPPPPPQLCSEFTCPQAQTTANPIQECGNGGCSAEICCVSPPITECTGIAAPTNGQAGTCGSTLPINGSCVCRAAMMASYCMAEQRRHALPVVRCSWPSADHRKYNRSSCSQIHWRHYSHKLPRVAVASLGDAADGAVVTLDSFVQEATAQATYLQFRSIRQQQTTVIPTRGSLPLD